MISALVSRIIILVFGTLYPAYRSYKAVKTKNVKEYVKWMMYWIVFALFTCVETFSDVILCWLPFYYEIKIVFVIWLLSPATRGSSILYRKFVHPQLMKREKDIDEYIAQATDKGCAALFTIGTKGLNFAANTVLTTAMKGQSTLVDHIRRSYSMNDISEPQSRPRPVSVDETIDETDNRFSEDEDAFYQEELNRSTQQPQRYQYTAKSGISSTTSKKITKGYDKDSQYDPLSPKTTATSAQQRRTYTREARLVTPGRVQAVASKFNDDSWLTRLNYWK
ncbi:receptor expression-enhancing protein 1-like isoform X2 [Tubulanus polymorphus]|uniref:receptor expression-enhancing protein 1-like isoform X2 n=1 Tax=Tubulanus polymorphus TaxID=672921 RepID=UPI003DA6BD1E